MEMSHKKGAPDERSPLGLDARAAGALVCHCYVSDRCDVTTSIQEDAISYQFGTDSLSIHSPPGQVSDGRVSSALPKKAIRLAVYRCIPSDPLDAGVSQNRSSGHEGEGPPARKAKGYGQWRWVGQHRVSRIGVPKASNDGVLA